MPPSRPIPRRFITDEPTLSANKTAAGKRSRIVFRKFNGAYRILGPGVLSVGVQMRSGRGPSAFAYNANAGGSPYLRQPIHRIPIR
jgi:hypothetical protein